MAAPIEPWTSGFVDDPARQCAGKRTYTTRAEVKRHIRQQVARGGDKLCAYRCQHCGMLHLGHAPSGRRSRAS